MRRPFGHLADHGLDGSIPQPLLFLRPLRVLLLDQKVPEVIKGLLRVGHAPNRRLEEVPLVLREFGEVRVLVQFLGDPEPLAESVQLVGHHLDVLCQHLHLLSVLSYLGVLLGGHRGHDVRLSHLGNRGGHLMGVVLHHPTAGRPLHLVL